jgi:hypothetical protein
VASGNRKRHERPKLDHGRAKPSGTCPRTGKVKYPNEAVALRAAASAAQKFHHAMRPYLCPFCGGHHLTSKALR